MTKQVDTDKYLEFVNGVTSELSKDHEASSIVFKSWKAKDFIPKRLATVHIGLCAESGEFTEVVKKIVFQGKPVNEDNIFHLKRELGDVMCISHKLVWLWTQPLMRLLR